MAQEYVPTDAYGLLRRIFGRGMQRVRQRGQVGLEESATYLVSRGLAELNTLGDHIATTVAAGSVGRIEWEPVCAKPFEPDLS